MSTAGYGKILSRMFLVVGEVSRIFFSIPPNVYQIHEPVKTALVIPNGIMPILLV
jgi:hypothetical protein